MFPLGEAYLFSMNFTFSSADSAFTPDWDQESRRLLAIAMARQVTRVLPAATLSRIGLTRSQLEDGIKPKLVGKEGRNVRIFQEKAGVDLLLNEEPEAILISSFDPFRREVARRALEILISDGRVQPAKIEEALASARSGVETQARQAGQKALSRLGLENVHPALVRVLGTLSFRTSFGQNQLDHSVETAEICGSLAAEMGFDSKLARRAGVFHDLGKALDADHVGSHAMAGADFAARYGEAPEIVKAIRAHHEESAPESWLDYLVIAADAVSGGRPGARNGSTRNLLERSEAMEKIARSLPGVTEAYSVQAGRALRVFVDCLLVKDEDVRTLARQIADRIQEELRFPGEIQITVLREMRVTEVAAK
jgi:ribonuclease Y